MIKVNDCAFSYDKKPFITNVTFHVGQGEIFGFLGPSGAGKSTLQKILIGLLKNYRGSVEVFDKEVRNRLCGRAEVGDCSRPKRDDFIRGSHDVQDTTNNTYDIPNIIFSQNPSQTRRGDVRPDFRHINSLILRLACSRDIERDDGLPVQERIVETNGRCVRD